MSRGKTSGIATVFVLVALSIVSFLQDGSLVKNYVVGNQPLSALSNTIVALEGNRTNSKQPMNESVSIIITSSLIPNHPSIDIINQTIYSLLFLKGLSTNVPIYITIDGLPSPSTKGKKKIGSTTQDRERLAEYTQRLQSASFPPFSNVHVLASDKYRHIAGNVHWAIQDYVSTQFVYVLQHDLAFKRPIEHSKLLDVMHNNTLPWLRNVRFRLRRSNKLRFPPCKQVATKNIHLENGLILFATAMWSDNNQLSTKAYYEEMFQKMKYLLRPMEGAMMGAAKKECNVWGQVVYGGRYEERSYLKHLDGRHSAAYQQDSSEEEQDGGGTR